MSLSKYIDDIDIAKIAELIDLDEDELAAIINGDMQAPDEVIKSLARLLEIAEEKVKKEL